jgi:ribokinase
LKGAFDVVVMHDFFVDRLVHAKSLAALMRAVRQKSADGGGGIHGVAQTDVAGGNAVNVARALARLGVRTLLVTHSEGAHETLLRRAFEGLDAELRIKPLRAGLTVALEGRTNVMLSDGGGASDFGPALLDGEDWAALRAAKVVCPLNWAANGQGTELLLALREKLGAGKTIFFDPADFRDRVPQFRRLLRLMGHRHLVDWVSMNEQEGKAAARALGVDSRGPKAACASLARRLGVVVDVHSLRGAYSSDGSAVEEAPVVATKVRRLTGAGDVWDAGSIYGKLEGMSVPRRLGFANAAARLYLENDEPVPPSLGEVLEAVAL